VIPSILQNEGFWHLKAIAAREAVLQAMDSARSFGAVQDKNKYACLDTGLHEYLLRHAAAAAATADRALLWQQS
jgi:hypothetical protein